MVFDTFESSLEGGRPIELFEFDNGSTQYRWTSAEDDVSFGGTDYTAIAITRSQFSQGPDDRDNTVQITVKSSNALANQYALVPPDNPISVRILRVHRTDTEVRTLWRGRVQNVSFQNQNEEAVFSCLPQVGASSRPIPRFTHAAQCPNVLYDNQCQVVRSLHQHTNTVSAVSTNGKELTVTNLFSAKGANWATAGHLIFGTSKRMVISQAGDVVTLNAPFQTSPLNQSVTVQAGCDRRFPTCITKFSNEANFRGFPYVPTRNLFNSGLDGTSS